MNKERFDYCKYVYDREFAVKDRLEKKAAALFTLPSTLIGVLFLNPKATEEIAKLFSQYTTSGIINFAVIVFLFFVLLLNVTLVLSILAITIKKYQKEYPRDLYKYLFEPERRYLKDKDSFLQEIAARMAIATMHNGQVNEVKARVLNFAVFSLLASVIMLFIFLLIYHF